MLIMIAVLLGSSGTNGGFMGPGYLLSTGEAEGEQVYQYFGAWPHSHGDLKSPGQNNSAIVCVTQLASGTESDCPSDDLALIELHARVCFEHNRRYTSRRDGFVSVDGDYAGLQGFGNDTSHMPTVTTIPLAVPPCAGHTAAQLQLNLKSSVVGFVAAELRCAGGGGGNRASPVASVCKGYSLERASRIRGNFIAKPAGWGDPGVPGDFTDTLKPLEGQMVSVHLVLPDTELYSIAFVCA